MARNTIHGAVSVTIRNATMKNAIVILLCALQDAAAFMPAFRGRNRQESLTVLQVVGPIISADTSSSYGLAIPILSNQAFLQYSHQPLVLSLFAGLSTCLGAAIVFVTGQQNENSAPLSDAHLAFCLSLAGSVMITVSLISILPECFSDHSTLLLPMEYFVLERCLSLVTGCAIFLLLSKYAFPEPDSILDLQYNEEESLKSTEIRENLFLPQDLQLQSRSTTCHGQQLAGTHRSVQQQLSWRDLKQFTEGSDLESQSARRSWRIAILLFVSLLLHNFPEGLAVAASALHSPRLGITTAIAIAIHNIPEGIAIAVPCLAARPDAPWLAFWLASLSGLAEPLGAFVALVCLDGSEASGMANVLALVAGIMITVAVLELLPEAARHANKGQSPLVVGVLTGAVVMIGSEAVLAP